MENDIFNLTTEQLKKIADTLKLRIDEGFQKDGEEIRCLPTYIIPKDKIDREKVLVLDLGGTNFRANVVDFSGSEPVVHPGIKKDLRFIMNAPEGYNYIDLYQKMAELISSLNLDGVKSIGYCFSYPCESTPDGDAYLLYWTKGVTIKNLEKIEGKETPLVGKSLMDYLNKNVNSADFKNIKVINDTVASLFAGLTDKKSQAHIGLIVGTGTNMALLFPANKLPKISPKYKKEALIPINLESGNFYPPYLTIIDDKIDKYSGSSGSQRFEKAISGMYLGRLLEFVFSCDEMEANFDAEKLTRIMSYPDMYKHKYVKASHAVYERSAKLVAASLAGLIFKMAEANPEITDVRLAAEGSLFWSKDQKGDRNVKFTPYKDKVLEELYLILKEANMEKIIVHVEEISHANLIGSGIAALSDTIESVI
ncbi:MAG: hexokinase [Dysgonamonadaceae bacterium]|jgi:hexokinase|nr:hexokinase [Dysgonamonadaceae bacterium]